MAQVPISDPRVQPTAPVPHFWRYPQVPGAAFGELQAQGTIAAGQKLGQAADVLSQIADNRQADANSRALKNTDVALANNLRTIMYGTPDNPGYLSLSGQDALNAAPQVQQQIQQAQANASASLYGNPRLQQLFEPVANSRISDTMAQVSSHVAQQRTAANIATSQARIDAATNDASASWGDPTTLAKSLAIAQNESNSIAGAKGYGTDSDVAAQLVRSAQAGIYGNVFKNALASDPSGATAARMYQQYGPQIPGDAQASIQDAITRQQKGYQAQQRGQIAGMFQDNLASLEATGAPANSLSNAQIMAAYPDTGARMLDQLHIAKNTYTAVQNTALTNQAQDAATLAGMTPHGLDFADQQQAQYTLQKVIAQKWSAIAKDPAGYVTANAPGMKDMLADAGSDPTQLPAFAGALDSAYDKLGLSAYNRPLLPQSAASGLVANILTLPPEEQSGQLLSTLNDYGSLSGRVLGDMVKAGLPPQYEVLAAMPRSSDRTLMAAAIGNTKQIRDGLGSGVAKQIDDALEGDPNLADLARSLSYAPGGTTKAGNIIEALKPMAYQLAQQGLDPASAAQRAAAAITTAKYDFIQEPGGNVARVPAGMAGPVETAADDLVSSLTADHLAAPANPSGINLTADQLQAIALKSAQRGYWVTNEADNGLVRMNDAGIPVMLANGKRLELPFGDAMHVLGGVADQVQAAGAQFLPGGGGVVPSNAPSSPAPNAGGATVPSNPPQSSIPNVGNGGVTVPQTYIPPSPIAP